MFKSHYVEGDFGMNSPISLNEIDNSKQFCTFSSGETKVRSSKIYKKAVRVLRVDLRPVTAKDIIHVISVGYNEIKQKENSIQLTTSKIYQDKKPSFRQFSSKKSIPKSGLQNRDHCKSIYFNQVSNTSYKSLSPFQRPIAINAHRFSKDFNNNL